MECGWPELWQKCLLLAGGGGDALTETEPCQRPKNEAANISAEKKPHSSLPSRFIGNNEQDMVVVMGCGKGVIFCLSLQCIDA